MPLCSLEEALDDLRAGKLLIVVDDENRENEGDLVMPAEMVNAEAVNFIATHARGLVCMPMTGFMDVMRQVGDDWLVAGYLGAGVRS